MDEPRALSPRDAMERWLDKQRVEKRDATVSTYYYRLKLFVEWAESQGIASMWDITGWTLETYNGHRRRKGPATITLSKEFGTLRQWLEYCARIEICDADLPEKLDIPEVSRDERSSDVQLDPDAARGLLEYYRGGVSEFGSREHVLLELAWHTAARAGAIAGLDLRDRRQAEDGTRYLALRNRPETGTPLKKGTEGERTITLSSAVWDALDAYVAYNRRDVEDEYGRQPVLQSRVGRPSPGTIRDWMYVATQPCIHSECPHGKARPTCDWTEYNEASKCPSSRAPHHVRTGAIGWMRNRGIPIEIVADRVNSSVETIKEFYDKADHVTEMLERRAAFTSDLDIGPETHNE